MKLLISTFFTLLLIGFAGSSYGQDIRDKNIAGVCSEQYLAIGNVCINPDLFNQKSTDEIVQLISEYEGFSTNRIQTQQPIPSGCFDATIQSPTPFMGNNGELFKLSNGFIGEVFAAYEYMYEYYPAVTICPESSFMIVDGKKLSITTLLEP